MYTVIDGYSTLLSKNKQKARSLLEKARAIIKPLVDQHNGEWHKDTLSSFPNPIDALNCALKIQKKLKNEPDINLRIGIHVGDALFGTADGVKVASGIGELAEPGSVCISEQVYYVIRNKIDCEAEFLGEKALEIGPDPGTRILLQAEGPGWAHLRVNPHDHLGLDVSSGAESVDRTAVARIESDRLFGAQHLSDEVLDFGCVLQRTLLRRIAR